MISRHSKDTKLHSRHHLGKTNHGKGNISGLKNGQNCILLMSFSTRGKKKRFLVPQVHVALSVEKLIYKGALQHNKNNTNFDIQIYKYKI